MSAIAEYWIAVQALTDESVSDEAVYFTDLTVTRDLSWNGGGPTDAVHTMPEASVFSRINHHRAKWGVHPQSSEETQLHG